MLFGKNDINVEEEIWILDIMKMSVPLIKLLRVHLGTPYLAESEKKFAKGIIDKDKS